MGMILIFKDHILVQYLIKIKITCISKYHILWVSLRPIFMLVDD